mmetsp:Transcript_19466/g.28794  ORF Transcript_19466/g.28794 Transcript_19466/m.28794 type:complete len:124 (-) Transcript_19466:101-472(-)
MKKKQAYADARKREEQNKFLTATVWKSLVETTTTTGAGRERIKVCEGGITERKRCAFCEHRVQNRIGCTSSYNSFKRSSPTESYATCFVVRHTQQSATLRNSRAWWVPPRRGIRLRNLYPLAH